MVTLIKSSFNKHQDQAYSYSSCVCQILSSSASTQEDSRKCVEKFNQVVVLVVATSNSSSWRYNENFLELLSNDPAGIYWYAKGWNWRAGIAWIMGACFLMPGLVQRAVDSSGFWPGFTNWGGSLVAWFLELCIWCSTISGPCLRSW